jgi:hypothetical protein
MGGFTEKLFVYNNKFLIILTIIETNIINFTRQNASVL